MTPWACVAGTSRMGGVTDQPAHEDLPPVPETGHADVDATLAGLELGDDVNAHPAKLANALDVLAQALASSGDPGGS